MSGDVLRWVPVGVVGLGVFFTLGFEAQRAMPVSRPLMEAVPREIVGYDGQDVPLTERMKQGLKVDDYVLRLYSESNDSTAASVRVYVAYYANQYRGKTIHSPKNCLPGAGWEAVVAQMVPIVTGDSTVRVNKYLLQKDDERALVLYWYQGRGRVEASEYKVKWDLLWDAAVRKRSEEALVQVVVPVRESEDLTFRLAASVAGELVSAMYSALPD